MYVGLSVERVEERVKTCFAYFCIFSVFLYNWKIFAFVQHCSTDFSCLKLALLNSNKTLPLTRWDFLFCAIHHSRSLTIAISHF